MKLGKKLRFVYLLQAGKRNFSPQIHTTWEGPYSAAQYNQTCSSLSCAVIAFYFILQLRKLNSFLQVALESDSHSTVLPRRGGRRDRGGVGGGMVPRSRAGRKRGARARREEGGSGGLFPLSLSLFLLLFPPPKRILASVVGCRRVSAAVRRERRHHRR